MKVKKFGLLAISAVALAMPIAASANFDGTISVVDDQGNNVLSPASVGNEYSSFANVLGSAINGTVEVALKDQWSVGLTATPTDNTSNPAGSYVSNIYFTLAPSVVNASGNAVVTYDGNNANDAYSVSVINTTNNQIVAGSFVDGQYNFTGLAAGVKYDWQSSFTTSTTNPVFTAQFSAAAVPEPEEWAMMLVGTGLVGFQLRRKQKGLSQLEVA